MTDTKRHFVTLDIERIHPDPTQPRLVVDTDLAESIKLQGILQPIGVEPAQPIEYECDHCGMSFAALADLGDWMINGGERRWSGARAAGLTTIDAEILPVTTEGPRLVRQLTANTGKPLTPVEEAFAYAALMQREGWSQIELAKQLGKPRSVVGDRIRLVSLHPAWLGLIARGDLQVSHAPVLSLFSDVPADYQAKAALALVTDYRAKKYIDNGDAIPVEEFKHLIYVAFRDYIKPLNDVRGYKGPVFSFQRATWSGAKAEKFAADINLWRPIWREVEKKRRKSRESSSGARSTREVVKWIDKLVDIPKRDEKGSSIEADEGEVVVYTEHHGFGWDSDMMPDVLLANVDRQKLTRVYTNWTFGIVTSDLHAVQLAKTAFAETLMKQLEPDLVELRAELAKIVSENHGMNPHAVIGLGCRPLVLHYYKKQRDVLNLVARALRIELHSDVGRMGLLSSTVFERLASALVAVIAEAVELPDIDELSSKLARKGQHKAFVLPDPDAKKKAERAVKKEAGAQRGKEIAIARRLENSPVLADAAEEAVAG